MRRSIFSSAVLCLAAALPFPAWGAASTAASPKPWLEEKIREGRALAERPVKPDSPSEDAFKKDAERLLDEVLDWNKLIERTVPKSQWRKLSDADRTRFKKLLEKLIRASYRSKLKLAAQEKQTGKKPREVEIDWVEEKVEDDEAYLEAKVRAGRDRVDLGFDLIREDDQWKVFDLAMDGVKTTRTYRSEFRKIISDEGWDGLFQRLEEKLEDVEAGRAEFGPRR